MSCSKSCDPAAFAIAYRMLGSVAEAEDVVQEALLRFHTAVEDGRADRVSARLRGHGGHPALDRPAPLGAGAPRELRGRVATGAARDRCGRGPRAPCRDGRLPVARLPRAAREPVPGAARGAAAARRVRLRLSRDRRDRREERGQRSPARVTRAAPRRRRAAPASRLRESSATSWRGASSRRPRRATWPRSSPCSPKTWCCTGTAGGKAPALARSLHGRRRVGRTLLAWMKQGARIEGAGNAADRGERPAGRDPSRRRRPA